MEVFNTVGEKQLTLNHMLAANELGYASGAGTDGGNDDICTVTISGDGVGFILIEGIATLSRNDFAGWTACELRNAAGGGGSQLAYARANILAANTGHPTYVAIRIACPLGTATYALRTATSGATEYAHGGWIRVSRAWDGSAANNVFLNPPRARMYAAGSQTGIAENTWTKLTGFTNHFESSSGMVDTTNSRLVIPVDGDWRINGCAHFTTSGSNIDVLSHRIRRVSDGATLAQGAGRYFASAAGGALSPASAIWPLAAGTQLELDAYWYDDTINGTHGTSGGAHAVFMEMVRLGPKSA